ncbi:MAG: pyruvate kinase alpha/beta domain-containing protein [Terracidiphilus sp.]
MFALSAVEVTINRLTMLWGTIPVRCTKVRSAEQMVDTAEKLLEAEGYVKPSEVIAIVAGTRTRSGSTNFMRLHVMGEQEMDEDNFLTVHEEAEPVGAKK